jgi:hypothetical protein
LVADAAISAFGEMGKNENEENKESKKRDARDLMALTSPWAVCWSSCCVHSALGWLHAIFHPHAGRWDS